MKQYAFKQGSRFSGNAEAVFGELEAIRKRNGNELKTVDVVETARKKTSGLHSYFEWDDFVAAEAHRRDIARHLVRSIIVISETEADKPHTAYINVISDDNQYYQNIEIATFDEYEAAHRQLTSQLNTLGKSIEEVIRYAKTDKQKRVGKKIAKKIKGVKVEVQEMRV